MIAFIILDFVTMNIRAQTNDYKLQDKWLFFQLVDKLRLFHSFMHIFISGCYFYSKQPV